MSKRRGKVNPMARYRKISVEIWNDERFRNFSDDAKLIFLFLLSHPHMTSLGAMRGTVPGLAAEIGWTLKRFTKGFNELLTEGRVKHDVSAAFVWLLNFLKHNGPENKNVVIAMGKAAVLLPECPMKQELLQYVKEFLKGYGKGFAEAFHEPLAKGMPTPEPEPEPEPESPQPPKGEHPITDDTLTPEEIRERWNAIPGVKPCRALGATIRTTVKARLGEHPDRAWWEGLFTQVRASDFLCGRTNGSKGPFQAPLSWILGPKNLDKILAGDYDSGVERKKERIPL